MRVKFSTSSGKVLKIGSAKEFLGVVKQWKYLVLYVDQRGPMKSGITGSCLSQSCWSCVATLCCVAESSDVFHLSSSGVAASLVKCVQLPVDVASWPGAM